MEERILKVKSFFKGAQMLDIQQKVSWQKEILYIENFKLIIFIQMIEALKQLGIRKEVCYLSLKMIAIRLQQSLLLIWIFITIRKRLESQIKCNNQINLKKFLQEL
ncbi:hypothetical protein TTHERM_001016219 (macronuclear) [Tetrahymena thermophila SB210]|uniref:Uncharacterized protein n=1 Tax=Tetrahymena thermophila (strain SB210) TaxID=312017 RepID=W7XGN2_TETTS|nr:hypothetical protein TTHERM_001016219 [Tetrahymena thermophila SB210]EWS72109.1 hypothetical protein TTHERM_001016219 [Tetrahymena thermophila SB210]|eukprot:XP_012655362.1 hypothetical protein TTHERM_001016219 [Tetrahymena thermophila SB210]